ncbi:MAG: OmpA family protein [Nitrospirota bacterium]|nr:OmpA family protein [Nitrospirota bacterium]
MLTVSSRVALCSAAIAAALTLAVGGCASTPDNQHTRKGAGVGALAGAVVGAAVGYANDPSGGALRGAAIGAAGGAAIGATAGHYMDKQEAEFQQQLADERESNQIEIKRAENEALRLTMNGDVSFDTNSAAIKPSFQPTLDKVADVLSRYNQTHIVIEGHTDSTGKDDYNQSLSEKRAAAVAVYLKRQGVSGARMSTVGRGESTPRATNDTAAGRALNRRVEVIIQPDQNAGAAR